MSIEEIIWKFIKEAGYLDNEHVLGILFCGSYLTGLNHKNSDIDLQIVFDDYNKEHLFRGNHYIEISNKTNEKKRIRIEYFEKAINIIYQTVDEDYLNQNNASLTIYGTSKIIWARDNHLHHLQEYTCNKFLTPLPPLSTNTAQEQVSIINNRMEKLETFAKTDDPYFEHLYQLTIEKIRRFYHSLIGVSRMETSKCFNLYTDEKYRKAFQISKLPEQEFINLYFIAIQTKETDKIKKWRLIKELWDFAHRNISLNNYEHRIIVESRNKDIDIPITLPNIIEENESIPIPSLVGAKIWKFIKEMNYLNDKHCLGVFVYGSSLTGFNTNISDIDLHIIYDNEDPNHFIRGAKCIDNTKIEYFEKTIKDIYLSAEVGYHTQNNVIYSLIGKGTIVFAKDNQLKILKQYIINRFSTPMPSLSKEEARNQVSILNNRMEKLEKYAKLNSPLFDHLSHITIEKIRKFYHKNIGISKIQTSKVYKIYTDEAYRKSMYKENPDQKFVNMYLNLITTQCTNRLTKLKMIKEFFDYATRNIILGDNYKIKQNIKPDFVISNSTTQEKNHKKIKSIKQD